VVSWQITFLRNLNEFNCLVCYWRAFFHWKADEQLGSHAGENKQLLQEKFKAAFPELGMEVKSEPKFAYSSKP